MLTFLFPANEEMTPEKLELSNDLKAFVKTSPPPQRGLSRLYRLLKKYFSFDYFLCTIARDDPFFEQMLLYPDSSQIHHININHSPEMLNALLYGPPKVVRIGSEKDHSITFGVIQKLFTGKSFSAMTMRSILQERTVFSLTLISFENKQPKAFLDKYADMAFLVNDILPPYFIKQLDIPVERHAQKWNNRFLPLNELPGMRDVCEKIWQVSRQDCPVLIQGETGTGKETVAETLYRASGRVSFPFIKVNCGALTESILESELFGHEKGAFTGAVNSRMGYFERASNGVLLLDEIGELSPRAQTRLLRVLQEGIVERLGGQQEKTVDTRVIAATNRDLDEMSRNGKFRMDLLYRLNVFTIQIPPLRDRPEDIPLIANFILGKKCSGIHLSRLPEISHENMEQLMNWHWPGNVRELANAVEKAVIVWVGNMSRKLVIACGDKTKNPENTFIAPTTSGTPLESLDKIISQHILRALAYANGKISGKGGAAELLGLHPNTLRAKMKKLRIPFGTNLH